MLIDEVEKRQAQRASLPPNVDIERGYAIIIAFGMFIVNAVLAFLARQQYFQEVSVLLVLKDAWAAIPLFFVLSMWFKLNKRWKQSAAFAVSCAVGCYIVFLFNEEGYYASMQRAPSLGTLWVWLFTELEWYGGVLSLAVVGAYVYVNEYSLI